MKNRKRERDGRMYYLRNNKWSSSVVSIKCSFRLLFLSALSVRIRKLNSNKIKMLVISDNHGERKLRKQNKRTNKKIHKECCKFLCHGAYVNCSVFTHHFFLSFTKWFLQNPSAKGHSSLTKYQITYLSIKYYKFVCEFVFACRGDDNTVPSM